MGATARGWPAYTFQPTLGWKPGTHVTVSIPGGKSGVQAARLTSQGTTTTAARDIGLLAESASVKYTTGSYSTMRLQQLLTQLGYLPLTWTADDPSAPAIPAASTNAQMSAAYDPPAGGFAFQSGYPSELTGQWKTGADNMLDKGAIIAFQADNNLDMDGVAGPSVWAQLFKAVAQNKQNPNGYTYSLVSQKSPERLRVYHNGQQILSTLVNTGVPGERGVRGDAAGPGQVHHLAVHDLWEPGNRHGPRGVIRSSVVTRASRPWPGRPFSSGRRWPSRSGSRGCRRRRAQRPARGPRR